MLKSTVLKHPLSHVSTLSTMARRSASADQKAASSSSSLKKMVTLDSGKKRRKKNDRLSFVEQRVAKYFTIKGQRELYFGKVTEFFPAEQNEGNRDMWHIVFEEGDEEDFYKKELDKAVLLVSEQKNPPDVAVADADAAADASKNEKDSDDDEDIKHEEPKEEKKEEERKPPAKQTRKRAAPARGRRRVVDSDSSDDEDKEDQKPAAKATKRVAAVAAKKPLNVVYKPDPPSDESTDDKDDSGDNDWLAKKSGESKRTNGARSRKRQRESDSESDAPISSLGKGPPLRYASKICRHPGGCTKWRRGVTQFCLTHGGVNICMFQGCDTVVKNNGAFCLDHNAGHGRRCQYPGGCTKYRQDSTQFCRRHG
jgi:hypothetical protein